MDTLFPVNDAAEPRVIFASYVTASPVSSSVVELDDEPPELLPDVLPPDEPPPDDVPEDDDEPDDEFDVPAPDDDEPDEAELSDDETPELLSDELSPELELSPDEDAPEPDEDVFLAEAAGPVPLFAVVVVTVLLLDFEEVVAVSDFLLVELSDLLSSEPAVVASLSVPSDAASVV